MSGRPMKELLSGVEGIAEKKLIANNTVWVKLEDGTEFIQLHDTRVAVKVKNKVTLNTGGWRTVTTKDRINEALRKFKVTNISLYSKKGVWRLAKMQYDPAFNVLEEYEFYDDIAVTTAGKILVNKRIVNGETKRRERLNKQIDAYIKKMNGMKHYPMPDGGDCWTCSMFHKTDCLESHLKEKYVHGSLIVNAMKEAGAGPLWYNFAFDQDREMRDWERKQINRFVRKYFKKHLGLA